MLAPVVLVVDDYASIRNLVAYVLDAKGYRVIVAADATEALEAAANHKGPIPLLVTDIAMPGVSGLELRERMAVERPETKVLFISAYPDWFEVGDYPVLAKPFTPDQLLSKIQEVLSAGASFSHAA